MIGKFCEIQLKDEWADSFTPRPPNGKYYGVCFDETDTHCYFHTLVCTVEGNMVYGVVNRFPKEMVIITEITE